MPTVSTALPGIKDEGSSAASRGDKYGGTWTTPLTNKEWGAAEEGSYYVAITPTPGTGIIGHAAPTTFDEAKPYVVIYNGHTTKSLYPQFAHLHSTVASAGGARVQYTVAIDVGNRRSSAGTALTINNVNGNYGGADAALILGYIGAVVGTAATGFRRVLGNIVFRGTIDIIEDDYQIVFGAADGNHGSTSRVATVAEVSRVMAPVVVPPGWSLLLHQWAAAQSTGPTNELLFGFILR